MTLVGLSDIAAGLGVSRRTAKRLAKAGLVSMELVDRRRLASPQVIESFRHDRQAISSWEAEGGALRGPRSTEQPIPQTS